MNYMRKFGNAGRQNQIDTFCRCLKISTDQSSLLIHKIEREMRKQETLAKFALQKQQEEGGSGELDKKIILQAVAETERKEGKIHKFIRLNWYWEIEKLRTEGVTWRAIARFIKLKHRQKISFSFLQKTFAEIEKELRE